MKILIVEDHREMREVLKSYVLISLSTEIVFFECDSGEEAIKLHERVHPDIICMDIELNGMDGIEATRLIRGIDHEVSIIIVSGRMLSTVKKHTQNLNVEGYIDKANLFNITLLLQNISK